jgi:chromatin remodeling complex protein RSC6
MTKTDKTSTTTKTASAAPAPAASVSAPVENVAVTASTKKSTKKATKTETTPVVAPVTTPVEVAAPVTTETEGDSSDSPSFDTKLNEVESKIQQLVSVLSAVKGDLKALRKAASREKKAAQKSSKASKKSSGNRKPSGFIKPALISDELAKFLGVSAGTEMARTEVAKGINTYINAHSLKDKENGRIIHADEKLSTLLKLKKGDDLNYFNLQRFLKPHFIKTEVATA